MACPGLDYLIVRRTMPELRKSHLKFIEAEMRRLGGTFNKTESIEGWRRHFNEVRPHSSLGYLTPAAFKAEHLARVNGGALAGHADSR
jgi:hypothetical protein